MKKLVPYIALLFIVTSCISTQSTIKNIDDNAPTPRLIDNTTFVITEFSNDIKYGYDKDYPINIYYGYNGTTTINQERFLNALAGPKGEKITYTQLESCCPFPTKRNEMGVGLLDKYELKWEGQKKPVILYLNIYEKGVIMVPFGLRLKK
ncbi:2-dehydro-3-deoxyphosphooctonate aldolase [Flavobacterium cellulosilyticum]|uniref:2-dehydro-3-deoxyphosphooctonate aldolase n=1 Tax=Flavobacterium cellulosilyticum TaxID=2541731 RepID=A0A4R5CGB7_9FLAO|nr:2-dehydro-3-deoxyphosphooctonate aldolase [Flavobacterium cellulosilyticum]TDD98715.1 2-dehydro-3-deoxyphosphooctonate aldolase [Flavobacterium cellulosilyticum]